MIAKSSLTFHDFALPELEALFGEINAKRMFREAYRNDAGLSHSMVNLLKTKGICCDALSQIRNEAGAMTRKFLFGLSDGYAIESVIIKRKDGYTACISAQVGCAVKCEFCASGQAGVKRNLSPGEIVRQVLSLRPRVNRIVFMGIGEPLNNYDNVLKAIRILRDRNGLDFSASGITISTVGIISGLIKLREEHLKINLTISLHATTQTIRDRIIPGARRFPIEKVIEHSLSWADRHNRTVTYVYLLLPGLNDTDQDLRQLVDWFAGRRARINLMRWNPVAGIDLPIVSDRCLSAFTSKLSQAGLSVVVRDTQGKDISAACGQLWLRTANTGQPVAFANSARV